MVSFFYSGPMPGPAATGCRGGWWAALRSTGIGPLVLTLMVFVGRGHAGEAVRDGEVEAQLISAATSLVPGQVATIGLRLKMDPGWHTYWANPGDSGMPTQIDWRLPEGYEISDFQWPAPKRHVEAGLASYIYEDEVVLPLRLTVPDTAEAGDQITLAATAGWLVCRDICSPGGAELSLSLPVSDSATEAAIDPRWVDLFRAADTLRPRLYPRAKLSILRVDGGYRITVDDPALESPWVAVDGNAEFFSLDPQAIDMAARQTLRPAEGAGLALFVADHRFSKQRPEHLRGVLIFRDGSQSRVYAVDEPIREKPAADPSF